MRVATKSLVFKIVDKLKKNGAPMKTEDLYLAIGKIYSYTTFTAALRESDQFYCERMKCCECGSKVYVWGLKEWGTTFAQKPFRKPKT